MKALAWINVLGVLCLAGLCARQWTMNRDLNLQVVSLDRTRQEQARKIDEQDRAIRGYLADLDDFRARVERLDKELKKTQDDLAAARVENDKTAAARDRAIAERDRWHADFNSLREALDKWVAAVKQRDKEIQKAISEIQALVKVRDEAVSRFNELANRYNALVAEVNKSAAAK